MKKFLYDLLATQPGERSLRHGGGKYGEMVFRRMVERDIPFSCFYDSSRWLNPKVKAVCEEHDIPLYDCHTQSVAEMVREYGIERIYSATPYEWSFSLPPECELYVTLHGLRGLELPQDWYFLKYKHSFRQTRSFLIRKIFPWRQKNAMMRRCQNTYLAPRLNCITVSEHTRKSLSVYFPKYKGEVPVFYSPNTSERDTDVEPSAEERTNGQYLLLVSGNRWEKNNLRAIIAFDRLVTNRQIDPSVRMKVTGCTKDIFRYKIKNEDRFDFMGYVDDDELNRLYAGAYLFIYPSLNEGFGYPPLEAMRYKVPVIASPFASMAEVLGGGVLFFNPFSVEEIMNRIIMMMEPETHSLYAKKGYEQYVHIRERQDRDLDALIDYLIADSPN